MSAITVGQKSYGPQEIIENAKKASGWYLLIAVFSLVNSVLLLLKVEMSFVVGLGVTQVVDVLMWGAREEAAASAAAVLMVVGLIINLMILGSVMLIWWLSKRGSKGAYVLGMVLYLLDGGIFVLVGDWVGVAFHGFFLFMLWGGYSFVKQWSMAQQMLAGGEGEGAPAPGAPQVFTA